MVEGALVSLVDAVAALGGVVARAGLVLAVPLAVAVLGLAAYAAFRISHLALCEMEGLRDLGGVIWKRDLYYAPNHTWVREWGARVRIGMDDVASRVFEQAAIDGLPAPGVRVHRGESLGDVVWGDRRIALASPVSGTVVQVNAGRGKTVSRGGAYDRGWLVEVAPDDAAYRLLPRGRDAAEWLARERDRLMACPGVIRRGWRGLVVTARARALPQWPELAESFLRPIGTPRSFPPAFPAEGEAAPPLTVPGSLARLV